MTTPEYSAPSPAVYETAPPLWAPYYGAPLGAAVQRVFKKYATFTGRASRSEYWWWALVGAVVGIVLDILIAVGMVSSTSDGYSTPTPGPLSVIAYILLVVWGLGVIVPSLALSVRRLHDVNMSGWMILLGLVPFVGGIVVLVFTLLPSKPEGQRFDVPSYAG